MKACLIIGPTYAMHYNDVYPLLLDKTLKVGVWTVGWGNIGCNWFTTLQVNRPDEKKLVLTKTYNPQDYPRYDNYDAIESKSKDIPTDYEGKIGVPITFFKYAGYLPYEIVDKTAKLELNGKHMFERLIIRRKQI